MVWCFQNAEWINWQICNIIANCARDILVPHKISWSFNCEPKVACRLLTTKLTLKDTINDRRRRRWLWWRRIHENDLRYNHTIERARTLDEGREGGREGEGEGGGWVLSSPKENTGECLSDSLFLSWCREVRSRVRLAVPHNCVIFFWDDLSTHHLTCKRKINGGLEVILSFLQKRSQSLCAWLSYRTPIWASWWMWSAINLSCFLHNFNRCCVRASCFLSPEYTRGQENSRQLSSSWEVGTSLILPEYPTPITSPIGLAIRLSGLNGCMLKHRWLIIHTSVVHFLKVPVAF